MFIICGCIFIVSFFYSTTFQAMENTLVNYYDGETKKVKLPFKYKDLSKRKQVTVKVSENETVNICPMTLLHEDFYYTLEHGEEIVAGPANPCVVMAFSDGNKCIAFHKAFTHSIKSAIDITKKELDCEDPTKISGYIFSNTYPDFDKKIFEDRTQLEEIKYLKDYVIDNLKISDRTQIKANLFTKEKEYFNNYLYAHVFVYIKNKNGSIKIRSTSPMRENILGNFNKLPPKERMETFNNVLIQQQLTMQELLYGKKEIEKKYGKYELQDYKQIQKILRLISKSE